MSTPWPLPSSPDRAVARLKGYLSYATAFNVEGVHIYPHADDWVTSENGHIARHPDQLSALEWAYEIRELELA